MSVPRTPILAVRVVGSCASLGGSRPLVEDDLLQGRSEVGDGADARVRVARKGRFVLDPPEALHVDVDLVLQRLDLGRIARQVAQTLVHLRRRSPVILDLAEVPYASGEGGYEKGLMQKR